MLRLLSLYLTLLILQGCLAEGEIRPSKALNQDTTFLEYRVVLPAEGWIKSGQPLVVSLRYPYSIRVTGSPYIEAEIGGTTERLYYNSGSGTEAINFRYIVNPADYDTDGIVIDRNIQLNGGSLEYTNYSGLKLPAPVTLEPPSTIIRVDGGLPVITSVKEPSVGRYTTGQNIDYEFFFSEKVIISGDVSFNIELGSGSVPVSYFSGSSTNKLVFRREVLITDIDTDGFSTNLAFNQDLVLNRAIRDQSGNLVSSVIPEVPTVSVMNTAGPVITLISPPANGTYVVGDPMDFTFTYSQNVQVNGNPALSLNLTTGKVLARYLSGSGTNSITFRHTVISGEQDLNGIELEPFVLMNGGSMKELGSTLNAMSVFTAPAMGSVIVSAFNGPSIFYYVLPKPQTYFMGEVLEFTVGYNRRLLVSGSPQLRINLGLGIVFASYVPPLPGDPGYNLVFRYTVQPGDSDLDGITLSSPIVGGGTITDTNSIPANLFFITPDASGVKISN